VFAQVACGKCGKPFQVPEARLGQPVVCSWCKETVTALPLAGVVPEALPDEDAPPLPAPPRRSRPWLVPVVIALLSMLALAVAFLGSRYYRGSVPQFVWQRFEAADGTCRVDLPGETTESQMPPIPDLMITTGGKKFTASSALTRVGGFIGWHDFDPAKVQRLRAEDVLAAERQLRQAETGWTVDTESTSAKISARPPPKVAPGEQEREVEKHKGFDVLEVRYFDGPRRFVEWYVFVNKGPHPRLYVVSVGGGNFDPDGETARRVLNSFWFDETK